MLLGINKRDKYCLQPENIDTHSLIVYCLFLKLCVLVGKWQTRARSYIHAPLFLLHHLVKYFLIFFRIRTYLNKEAMILNYFLHTINYSKGHLKWHDSMQFFHIKCSLRFVVVNVFLNRFKFYISSLHFKFTKVHKRSKDLSLRIKRT